MHPPGTAPARNAEGRNNMFHVAIALIVAGMLGLVVMTYLAMVNADAQAASDVEG